VSTTVPGTPARVLVVDDDPTVAEVVRRYLERDGFVVESAADGVATLAAAAARPPDLVVLDLGLPGVDGLEVCRQLRSTSPVPIVMLTARGGESDRILGLEMGADDYVTKPFSPRELVLRVKSVLRRAASTTAPPPGGVLTDGGLVVDMAAHEVTVDGRRIAVTAREYDLLVFFLRHPGEAFERTVLLERVWGWTYADATTVTVHVRRLREKVEVDPALPARIVTVWGVGYRYEPGSG
jgi:DNA-binding response OmpR family regulator